MMDTLWFPFLCILSGAVLSIGYQLRGHRKP